METDAQITSWPGYDGIVREAGYTNAPYPVTQNAEMTCITGGVHIRLSAARAGVKAAITALLTYYYLYHHFLMRHVVGAFWT